MKAIVVEAGGSIYTIELGKPLYRSAARILEGPFEIVRPKGLRHPYVFLVNEVGLLQGLPRNDIGSWLYLSHVHGHPIVGNVIFMKEVKDDLAGLDPDEIDRMINELKGLRELMDFCKDVLREEIPL